MVSLLSCRKKARSFRGEETKNHAGHLNQKGMGCVDSEACAIVGGGWGSKATVATFRKFGNVGPHRELCC